MSARDAGGARWVREVAPGSARSRLGAGRSGGHSNSACADSQGRQRSLICRVRIYAHRAMGGRLLPTLCAGLVFLGLVSATVGCGETPSTGNSNEPANTPGASPNDAASVNCPGSGGPSSGTLTGLGATIGQFRQVHPQDPKYTSQFGATITGGVNNGLPELTARCSTGGVIVSVDQNFDAAKTAAQVKASMMALGIAPADSVFQSAQTLATCEIYYYGSPSIASDPGANDNAGTFVVELEPPADGSTWNPANVASLIYDLDESGGC